MSCECCSAAVMQNIHGEVHNYKYWGALDHVSIRRSDTLPTKEAIDFEKRLHQLESQFQTYEMGLLMKQACQRRTPDRMSSIEAIRSQCSEQQSLTKQHIRKPYWHLEWETYGIEDQVGCKKVQVNAKNRQLQHNKSGSQNSTSTSKTHRDRKLLTANATSTSHD